MLTINEETKRFEMDFKELLSSITCSHSQTAKCTCVTCCEEHSGVFAVEDGKDVICLDCGSIKHDGDTFFTPAVMTTQAQGLEAIWMPLKLSWALFSRIVKKNGNNPMLRAMCLKAMRDIIEGMESFVFQDNYDLSDLNKLM